LTYHKATEEQWGAVEATHTLNEQDFNRGSSNTAILIACILELRSRIENLEAERGAWRAVERLGDPLPTTTQAEHEDEHSDD